LNNFRPQTVGELFGQDHLLSTLADYQADPGIVPRSLMLVGPYGCGKTSIARMLGQIVGAKGNNLREINAASARGIDDVRDWVDGSRFLPLGGGSKVYILDELHQMTNAAQSALLKVIEEPPPGVYWFLCTTDPSKLLPTIASRCHRLEVRLLELADTRALLNFLKYGFDDATVQKIHIRSQGHARDAVKIADIVKRSGSFSEEEVARTMGMSPHQAGKVIDAVINNKLPRADGLKQLLTISDETAIGDLVDQWADYYTVAGYTPFAKCYSDLLFVRSLKKEYKIKPREQLLHLFSLIP
jgi:DNA polymerase-3 subunit gamma/tau